MFGKSKYVSQIWIYGNSFKVSLVAVVVPNIETVMSWASKAGLSMPFAELCQSQELRDLLVKDIEVSSITYL